VSIGTNNETYWFLLYTKPHQEDRAKKNLENQQFITFLPKIATQDLKKKSTIIKPLFPRYLFVILDINSNKLQAVKFTKGVSHIVMFGEKLSLITDRSIKILKSKLDNEFIFYPKTVTRDLKKGDCVHITRGKFSGLDAIFLTHKPKERIRVLLQFMKKSILADIPKAITNYQYLSNKLDH